MEMSKETLQNVTERVESELNFLSYQKSNMPIEKVVKKLIGNERPEYKEAFLKSGLCNLTTCRYNQDGKCTNEDKRKECVEVSRKVLCLEDNMNENY